jgi:hypothetical protein
MFSILMAAFLAGSTGAVPGPPLRTGECKWVHGRFSIYNGSSLRRIWIIGTHRIVALDDRDENIPLAIAHYQSNATEHFGVEDALFGDFRICALERNQPGRMQHVRLVRTRNLIYRGTPFRPD